LKKYDDYLKDQRFLRFVDKSALKDIQSLHVKGSEISIFDLNEIEDFLKIFTLKYEERRLIGNEQDSSNKDDNDEKNGDSSIFNNQFKSKKFFDSETQHQRISQLPSTSQDATLNSKNDITSTPLFTTIQQTLFNPMQPPLFKAMQQTLFNPMLSQSLSNGLASLISSSPMVLNTVNPQLNDVENVPENRSVSDQQQQYRKPQYHVIQDDPRTATSYRDYRRMKEAEKEKHRAVERSLKENRVEIDKTVPSASSRNYKNARKHNHRLTVNSYQDVKDSAVNPSNPNHWRARQFQTNDEQINANVNTPSTSLKNAQNKSINDNKSAKNTSRKTPETKKSKDVPSKSRVSKDSIEKRKIQPERESNEPPIKLIKLEPVDEDENFVPEVTAAMPIQIIIEKEIKLENFDGSTDSDTESGATDICESDIEAKTSSLQPDTNETTVTSGFYEELEIKKEEIQECDSSVNKDPALNDHDDDFEEPITSYVPILNRQLICNNTRSKFKFNARYAS
jgi:hypothetical protein